MDSQCLSGITVYLERSLRNRAESCGVKLDEDDGGALIHFDGGDVVLNPPRPVVSEPTICSPQSTSSRGVRAKYMILSEARIVLAGISSSLNGSR